MKKYILLLALMSGCKLFGGLGILQRVQLTPQQDAILVEETNPARNEWLHDNCQIKNADFVRTARRAKLNADKSGANYVEVLYSDSPFSLYSIMFACPNIPPY
jgi:hypothetical protein